MGRTETQKAPTDTDQEIGHIIRSHRLERNISQATLAQEIGVTFQQVQKYEKGVNRVSAARLQRIADALDVPIATFYATKDERDEGLCPSAPSRAALAMASIFDKLDPLDQRAVARLVSSIAKGLDSTRSNA